MPTTKKRGAARASRAPRDDAVKRPKSYRLSEQKIAAAQEILGAPTATATIELALDMVVFRQQLIDGTAALRGMSFAPFDG